jgi:uncharacterized membrane protein YdfJ with MMPL/SSD domain
MSTYLYRLGAMAFDHRRAMLAAWLAVFVGVIAAAVAFSGKTNNSFSVPGTESQQAQELLEQKFPAASGAYARMVFQAPAGTTLNDPDVQAAVMASVEQAGSGAEVIGVIDPYTAGTISADGTIGFADVRYPVSATDIQSESKDQLEASAGPAEAAGLDVEWAGGVVKTESHSAAEAIGIAVGFLVLAITLTSLVAAGLPLMSAIFGVIIGIMGLTAVTGVVEVSDTAPTLATMLGLAVGIDYALFILSRHRQGLHDGLTPRESTAQAIATAGSAVVFAGMTVIIALVGLLVVDIPFLTVMGLAAAGTVATAVLVAITLVPALFGFFGQRLGRTNRVLGFNARRRDPATPNLSTRWARLVTRRPLFFVAGALALTLTIAIPATHMKLGLPDDGSQPTSTTERKAYDLLTDGFGPGFNGPLTLVIEGTGVTPEEQAEIASQVVAGLEGTPGVAAVSDPVPNEEGDLTVLSVTPTTSPSSDETKDLVEYMRGKADEIPADAGVAGYVTGTTALNIDTADRLAEALPMYVAVVVGLALILLTVVFRSILVPIKAAIGFLLTIATAMGLTVWIFQDGNLADLLGVSQEGPIVSFLPILMIGILFGLAMDYEVFLVSRMREAYVHGDDARQAIVTGFGHSGRVVTAAAIIMTSVFAAFLLDPSAIVKSIAVALAFGVLIDAFVVRMTLVPAVMALMGKAAWWLPKGVDKRLPDIDIEGNKLLDGLRDAPNPA